MPPFVGTELEKRALAIHLARLGGDAEAGLAPAVVDDRGEDAFETHCGACHGPDSPWPMAARLGGRTYDDFYDLLGRLSEVQEEMPAFAGTEEERVVIAEHLAELSATPKEEVAP
jgi:mono/diheme cytochrome c family protein